jgi:amidohydrolase
MIDFGALEGVDYIIALHVDPELAVGTVGVRRGAFTAAFDEFHFTILGESGHGARPHHCVDPIFVQTQLANALYNAVGRTVDARDPMVLSIGMIGGGQAPNIIPERASMSGSIRTLSREHRAAVRPLLVRIADGVCATYGANYELDLREGAPAIINDGAVTEVIRSVATDLVGPAKVHEIPLPSMGSEDYSYYLQEIPGAMFRLGAATDGAPRYFLHSARFIVDEGAIALGSSVLAHAALRLIERGKPA